MGLQELLSEKLFGPPDTVFEPRTVDVKGLGKVVVGEDGLLHLSRDQLNVLSHSHRGTIKPFIAKPYPDGTYTLTPNTERKNN